MSRSDIEETVRDMWTTRPRRRKNDKKIGGVAAAIGRRYQLDPVLVRIGFVVATFVSGVGIVLYLAGWLLLPEEGDEASGAEALIGRGHSSMSTAMACLLGLAMIPASAALLAGAPSALAGLAFVGAALFLLHRHRGGASLPAADQVTPYDTPYDTAGWPATAFPAGAQPPVTGTPSAPSVAADPATAVATVAGPPVVEPDPDEPNGDQLGVEQRTVQEPVTGDQPAGARVTDPTPALAAGTGAHPGATGVPPGQPNPPAWDPLGVAPFAWDLPDPSPKSPPPPPAPKRRSAVTPVTLGLALIAGAATAVAATYNSYLGVSQVLATVLAVIGAGLVVGAFVRGGRGLIWFAIPLAMATWISTVTLPLDRYANVGIGDKEWSATTLDGRDGRDGLQPKYEVFIGNGELDLSGLRLADGAKVATTVEQLGTGNLTVTVPSDMDVQAVCSTRIGNVDCLGQKAEGPGSRQRVTEDVVDSTATINLTIKGGIGNVELVREEG